MTEFNPEIRAIDDLDVFVNPHDIRRDLHAFVTYIADRNVTRTYRENRLPKADAMRLARKFGDPDTIQEIKENGESQWIDHVDALSLRLKLVSYETKGVYAGYSSSSESYPDNDIIFECERYKQFLQLSPQAQEDQILAALLDNCSHSKNEFLTWGPVSRLDRFGIYGCATGVLPIIPFAKIRRQLLSILAECHPGTWYSISSLVEHLKTDDPYFLIPEVLPKKAREISNGRYQNFYERKDGSKWVDRTVIAQTEPRAFDRVEGRFVERFIDGIPLEMGYVDVAYAKGNAGEMTPSLGLLKAFRLTPRCLPAIRKAIPEPKVTVLPNFEVYIESAFYPAGVLAALAPLGDITTEDVNTVLKLKKQNVAQAVAENPEMDVVGLLGGLASNTIPANVERELEGWVGHSESFVLYEGFGLLEGSSELPEAKPFVVERISPTLAVVAKPGKLYNRLEAAERVPVRIRHTDDALLAVPAGSTSVFAAKRRKSAPRRARAAIVKRSVQITLHFPARELFDAFLKALLDAQCVVESSAKAMTFSYSEEQEKTVETILGSFRKKHGVEMKST